ncbi:MAG: DUF4112 domain-containing protein [Gammaproteobacteria bacterium]|nr:DUF4112 domain-containing protein [Gammaproteobacteria bacterium]
MADELLENERLRRRLVSLARLMDSSIRIPVIGKRIGWDAVIGLVPGIGDAAGALISGYIVVAAMKLGAPARVITRMAGNVGVEMLVGAVPLVGDLFDMAFRANERNVALLEEHLDKQPAVVDAVAVENTDPNL